ncbi:PLC-like phosphodiesterase [Phyllosticta capitalensis]
MRQSTQCAGDLLRYLVFSSVLSLVFANPFTPRGDASVRLNEMQVMGTHNSYHKEVSILGRPFFELLMPSPQDYFYSHASFPNQLDYQAVRSLEIDLYADYEDPGLFADPLIRRLGQYPPPTKEWSAQMKERGAKVFHIPDADVESVCPTFKDCLTQLRDWSNSNPGHLPILIDLEFKTVDERIVVLGGPKGEQWNATNIGYVDEEIRSILTDSRLITPDDVRLAAQEHAKKQLTLEEAVLQYGWPTLDESRGKFLFYMDNDLDGTPPLRDFYRGKDRKSLEGRVIFTNSQPGEADAAFIKMNDPTGDKLEEIQSLVRKGYLIRTRSDEPIRSVLLPLDRSRKRLEQALSSGAQIVSTDWPVMGMASRYGTDYVAELPGRSLARCNPVIKPEGCKDDDLLETTGLGASRVASRLLMQH